MPKTLYRTNPSIPRPESKYGTRSSVYEQILALKQASLDTTSLVVYEPEDVLLVKDLMQLESRPLNEVLTCLPMRTDEEIQSEMINQTGKFTTNVNMTPMGRPINIHRQIRWKQLEAVINDEDTETDDRYYRYETTSSRTREP